MLKQQAMKRQNADDDEEELLQQQHPMPKHSKGKQKQPPMKMSKNIRGHLKEYTYWKTVKSVKELEEYLFEVNNCRMRQGTMVWDYFFFA
jgi:hypothetical protein